MATTCLGDLILYTWNSSLQRQNNDLVKIGEYSFPKPLYGALVHIQKAVWLGCVGPLLIPDTTHTPPWIICNRGQRNKQVLIWAYSDKSPKPMQLPTVCVCVCVCVCEARGTSKCWFELILVRAQSPCNFQLFVCVCASTHLVVSDSAIT